MMRKIERTFRGKRACADSRDPTPFVRAQGPVLASPVSPFECVNLAGLRKETVMSAAAKRTW
jgi:hypothetical protein